MKSLTPAAGVALLVISSAGNGAALTLGGPLSQSCYEAALSGDATHFTVQSCDRSLTEEALTQRDRAATFVNRGVLQMLKGARGEADSDFDSAIKLDHNLADAWLNKAFLRLRDDRGGEALPLIEESIKLGPQRKALAYFARGLAYEDVGDLNAAYADLRRAHDLEPNWSLPAQYLARYQVVRNPSR
jgi:tetratricopeptide (TPR) repeat protein